MSTPKFTELAGILLRRARTHSCRRRRPSARIATLLPVALAGVLTLGCAAPQSAADAPEAVALTTASSAFQPALDELLAEMQRLVAQNAQLPYAPPGSEAELLTLLQNTNYQLLSAGLSRVTQLFNGVFFQSPEVIAGNAADPRQYFDFFTPDIIYRVTAGLAPGATYVLTGSLGGATEHFSISALAITAGTAQTQASLELGHDLVVNPDGTFTVVIGPDQPWWAPNYMDSTDATAEGAASLLIRDMIGNWALGTGGVSLHCIADCPPFFAIPEGGFFPSDGGLTAAVDAEAPATKIDSVDSMLTMLFSAFAQVIGPFNDRSIAGGYAVGMGEPVNTMFALAPQTQYGAGLESAVVSGGNFDLADGQALIVKIPEVPAAYSGIELMNAFGGTLPYVLAQTTLNNTTAYHADDGYTYYVISATNPGVANWLNSGEVTRGEIFARFENVTDRADAVGLPVETYLVPVADVRDYLPADTPDVSPEQYAADMAQRVLSYDYALDTARMTAQPDWVTQQLLWHALPALMGQDNFEAVFGNEPATPMWLRMTPAFEPDWNAVSHSVLSDPITSLTAVVNNLPLLYSDVTLPINLALAQLAASVVIPGYPSLGDILREALFDPNTSITAGLLNARDDLATAIMAATDGFPTQLGELATLQWAHMPELLQHAADLDPADLLPFLQSLADPVG